jgi:hypothetical protein
MQISATRSPETKRVTWLGIHMQRASDQIFFTQLVKAMQSGKPFTLRLHEEDKTTSWVSEQEVEEFT